ncbi:hypothetical protein [Tautonia rosea]|uniref:hypothetical protein n=1 Tax=Tautonia rosea TaxID=2728037 RepID=UPI001473418F|nr:hypothetical protein [Tautonia rosea]
MPDLLGKAMGSGLRLRGRRSIAGLMLVVLIGGCAHQQLSMSTVLTANSFQTIIYQIVLNNIAMFADEPTTLPWHVRVRDGTVQIQDRIGIGQQGGGFSTFEGGGLGIETYGPQGSRQVALQWGTDAVGDPIQLYALQTVYRRVLGLPPLPEPNFIAELSKLGSRVEDVEDADSFRDTDRETRALLSSVEVSRSGEVPRGWFFIGAKKDVPKAARYVGRHGDCYVWVMPEGVGGLARFTLLVLSIVKFDAAEQQGGGGLMFTPD